jgi:hypothetical protein
VLEADWEKVSEGNFACNSPISIQQTTLGSLQYNKTTIHDESDENDNGERQQTTTIVQTHRCFCKIIVPSAGIHGVIQS